MSRNDRSRDISVYVSLIDDFVAAKTTAPEFEKAYLGAIKREHRMIAEDLFSILQELFEDADAYVSYPELRTEPEDLDDDQLRACAIRARDALGKIGFE